MIDKYAKFSVGQLVHHRLFNYRGVVVDVDPVYQNTDAWYQMMTKSNPPKDKPWYHILVDDADYITYVAEQNLEPDDTGQPITHPSLEKYFEKLENGSYISRSRKHYN